MTNDAALGACFGRGVLQLRVPNIERTYNQVSITSAMDLICKVDGAAPAIGDGQLALLRRFEVPDGVVVLWMLLQLLGGQGRHGGDVLLRVPSAL
jgi:hypothetical protein